MQAAIHGFQHVLRAEVERCFVGRRENQNRRPGIAILALVDRQPETAEGPRRDVLAERCAAIETYHVAIGTREIDQVFVFRIDGDVAALAAAGQEPVARVDMPMVGAAVHGDGAAVLLCAVNGVRERVIGGDVIKLRGGLVIPGGPRFAAIEADGCALIDAQCEMRCILGIDPYLVVIVAAGCSAHNLDGLAAVLVR